MNPGRTDGSGDRVRCSVPLQMARVLYRRSWANELRIQYATQL